MHQIPNWQKPLHHHTLNDSFNLLPPYPLPSVPPHCHHLHFYTHSPAGTVTTGYWMTPIESVKCISYQLNWFIGEWVCRVWLQMYCAEDGKLVETVFAGSPSQCRSVSSASILVPDFVLSFSLLHSCLQKWFYKYTRSIPEAWQEPVAFSGHSWFFSQRLLLNQLFISFPERLPQVIKIMFT